jgi:DNA helicase-2/ATP-dependent DNA helicase PcrA
MPDSRPGVASPIDFERQLNTAQRRAVTSVEGPHLVIAGAGSGKTRTLVYRVANLVLEGVAPESILLLTFTRRAAQEMLRRAAALLDERCRRVAGGTYHSFANLVLRRHAQRLDYSDHFTIIDRSDAVDMMGVLRTEGGYDRGGKRFPRADTLVNVLSKQVNTHRPLEELLAEDYPQFADDLEAITDLEERYRVRKKEQNVMDYDDLLVNLRRLLVEHPAVRKKLSATYRYVMVDEYQDTNRLQAHISALLASGHGNLMVVGDDAQSIYSFRGASFRNIIDFPKIFPDAKTVLLEQNYRSTQPILDLGNAILENAREKYSKKLFTEVPGDVKPVFLRTSDDYSQAHFVCERILELREEGVSLGEIAVLSRAAWHSNTLELELKSRNIPFRKFGGIKFVEAAHVKDVCALLKISLNPLEAAAWFRVLQLFEGVGPKTAQRIAGAVTDAGGEIGVLVAPTWANKRFSGDLERLHGLLSDLEGEDLDLAERLGEALEVYGEAWLPKKYDDAERRKRDLESLQVIAGRYDELEAFLSDLAIDPPDFVRSEAADREDEWMTVSTVHSAKGLEWHTVFVLHLLNGRFPSFNALRAPNAYEEERRLLYVAVTRAKSNLYLMKPEEISGRGGYYEIGELSPLIAEIKDFDRLVDEQSFALVDEEEDELDDGFDSGNDGEQLRRIQDYFAD